MPKAARWFPHRDRPCDAPSGNPIVAACITGPTATHPIDLKEALLKATGAFLLAAALAALVALPAGAQLHPRPTRAPVLRPLDPRLSRRAVRAAP